MRIYNKKNIPWYQKGSSVTPINVKKTYGWSNNKEDDLKISNEKNFFSSNYNLQQLAKQNITNDLLNNNRISSMKDRIEISNPYITVAQITKKVIDKGKNIINNFQKREEYLKRDKQKQSNVLTSCLSFIGAFLFLIIFISISVLPIISSVSVVLGGAEYFSTRDNAIVTVAIQEVTYQEYNIGGEKYKAWYGIDGNWCAMFVSWCANQCGYIDYGIMPRTASVANMAAWYQAKGQWRSQESGYEPEIGDIIFFQEDMSHVGIVVNYDAERKVVYTIEGNTGISKTEIYHQGSWVLAGYYPITYYRITGYGVPEYPIQLFGSFKVE